MRLTQIIAALITGVGIASALLFAGGPHTSVLADNGPKTLEWNNPFLQVYAPTYEVCGRSYTDHIFTQHSGTATEYMMRFDASGGGTFTLSVEGRIDVAHVVNDGVTRPYTLTVQVPSQPIHNVAVWGSSSPCSATPVNTFLSTRENIYLYSR